MYPGPDGYNFDFDKDLRGDTLRVTPQLGQKGKKGPEFNVAAHDMYSGKDGYNFDYDIKTAGQPYAHSLA